MSFRVRGPELPLVTRELIEQPSRRTYVVRIVSTCQKQRETEAAPA